MKSKELKTLIEYLEKERGIKAEVSIALITEAIHTAARKNMTGLSEHVHVEYHKETGEIEVLIPKKVVEKVENPKEEISIEAAREHEPDCEIGQILGIPVSPDAYGRIAAQAAKQLMSQKLKSAERDVIYGEYKHREGDVISGAVKGFTRDRRIVVDLGKVEAFLPEKEYPRAERYNIGDKVEALLFAVNNTDGGGAEIILTRSRPEYVAALFKREVPELENNTIEIVKIEREAGFRTMLAVRSNDSKVDPVGACVGNKGGRIQHVVSDLHGEKIDICRYDEDPDLFLQNLVGDSKDRDRKIIQGYKESEGKITIIVADDDYALVIGKNGTKARLIGKMLGTHLEVKRLSEHKKLLEVQMRELADCTDAVLDEPIQIRGVNNLIIDSLKNAGIDTLRKFLTANPEEISKIPGVQYHEFADRILEQFRNTRS